MRKRNIYSAIGIFEIVTGVVGGGFLLWGMTNTDVVSAAPILAPLYLAFALLFVVSGGLLIKGNIVGVWSSVLAQLIAMPSYTSIDFSFAFNNVLRFSINLSTGDAVVGIDVVAAVLFFYLALSLPPSTDVSAE